MKRPPGIVCYILAAVVAGAGLLTALQIRAPWWQKGIVILIVLTVAAGLVGVGRRTLMGSAA